MRYIMVVLLLIAPLVSAASVDQQKPDSGIKKGAVQTDSSDKQERANEKHAPEKAADTICNGCSIQEPAGQTQKQDTYNPKQDTLYRAYLWFTIIGVLIALGGIGVLLRQNRQISRQTEHLERQIEIQQRSSRQWLNVLEWRQHLAEEMPNNIGIYFQIENPTDIPLRLDAVMSGALGQQLDSGLVTFLAPDNPFPMEFFVRLNAEQMALYEGNGLVLEVEVSVFFTDAFDNQWNQIFQRMLLCRRQNNYLYVRESRTRMRRSGPNDPHED
jgi:hypothetical protein